MKRKHKHIVTGRLLCEENVSAFTMFGNIYNVSIGTFRKVNHNLPATKLKSVDYVTPDCGPMHVCPNVLRHFKLPL